MKQPDLRTFEERTAYTPQKHYQGRVCIHGHDHGGFSWRHNGHRNCVDCTRQGARRWSKENPERAAASTKRRDIARVQKRRAQWPIAFACSGAKARAREIGVPCNITPDSLKLLWRKQEGRCYWTGLELSFDHEADRHPLKPSIDRLVPAAGYCDGNVVWATNLANRARGDCPVDEFAEILKKLASAYQRALKA